MSHFPSFYKNLLTFIVVEHFLPTHHQQKTNNFGGKSSNFGIMSGSLRCQKVNNNKFLCIHVGLFLQTNGNEKGMCLN